jgi:hypothetical protein
VDWRIPSLHLGGEQSMAALVAMIAALYHRHRIGAEYAVQNDGPD